MEAGKQVKVHGNKNDLVERIAADPMFGMTLEEINSVLEPKNYIGRAPQQVVDFINDHVKPVMEKNKVESFNVDLKV